MTTHPLYLPAALIPAFVAGRVTMLIEPLKVQPVRMMADGRDLGEYVMKSLIDLPHAPGDRLTLADYNAWAEVVSVDVKRVQDVTFAESQLAGFGDMQYVSPLAVFRGHFTATHSASHGPGAWDRNPLCTFTTIKPHAGNVEGRT